MKFSTSYLMALTALVALVCAVWRFLGPSGALGAFLVIGFFLAPSLLTFAFAPFKTMSVVTRQQLMIGLLIMLGGASAVLTGVIVNPALGAFLLLFAIVLWLPQYALLEDSQFT